MPRCDDPTCTCHPPPKKPPVKPPCIEIFLRGAETEQICQIHQPGELDVFFDLIQHTMTIREIIKNSETRKMTHVTYLKLEARTFHLVNLHGLDDNSLFLKLQLKQAMCAVKGHKMRVKTKHFGFMPAEESKLYTKMYCCDWKEQNIEVLLPGERIHGWKTVALILGTFHRISKEHWCLLVNMAGAPEVAGLNWKQIERQLWPSKVSKESDVVEAKPKKAIVS
ncbi:uncharacterized protein ACLA_091290 [Aspergillus clavatus NRRL 1]|uniref:Uncharacterized protein n=1 Tax=Aspergillus clavatus (strain ATCC 1007 / CBS 513.65 / DSM 816 / NCTC 3887 / NRRL 1 / QM 1276 / 107) TaxID=344612 RepID=A1CEY2_ASPCL|nr:uncharacterized protein ACLA_091290 [Aspergillus clavatus NRRL 1]EAW11431.1 conserved hypothetical protein [Aspergillus clavatus NRRL 1]